MKGGAKVVVEKHRHEGIFVARGKEDALVTKNMVVGESVYGEKRISVDVRSAHTHAHSLVPISKLFFFSPLGFHFAFFRSRTKTKKKMHETHRAVPLSHDITSHHNDAG